MTYEFDEETYDAPIPDGEIVRAKLKIVGCEVPIYEGEYPYSVKTDRTEPGYRWECHVIDGLYAGQVVSKEGRRRLRFPLSPKATHYKLAKMFKGKNLTKGEIEGAGSFGDLLDTLVNKIYDVKIGVNEKGSWNTIDAVIGLSGSQKTAGEKAATLEEDEIPNFDDFPDA